MYIYTQLYLQLTNNSTDTSSAFPTPLLAFTVKFFVSVHKAFSMVNDAVDTEVSLLNSSVPLSHDALAKGLLVIFPINVTFSLSLTYCFFKMSMVGWSKKGLTNHKQRVKELHMHGPHVINEQFWIHLSNLLLMSVLKYHKICKKSLKSRLYNT